MADYGLAVIGSGPGGYVAALRASDIGLKVAVVEQAELGGICLNVGCIPTKLMVRSTELFSLARHASDFGVRATEVTIDWPAVIARKDKAVTLLRNGIAGLLKARRVDLVKGRGRLAGPGRVRVTDPQGQAKDLTAEKVIIASGSVPAAVPGLEFAPPPDGRIYTSDDLTRLQSLPESLLIVGGGYIGCEFAVMLAEVGVRVTVVEMLDHLLTHMDEDLARMALRILKKLKVDVRLATKVEGVDVDSDGLVARLSDGRSVEADAALVAVGRKPKSRDLGLEEAGVAIDNRGAVIIDEHCQTNVENVYAIGDVTGKIMLAHAASRQGIVAAEHAAGKPHATIDYGKVPGVVFLHPELASVGLSEAEARERVKTVKVARFNQQILGRDQAEGPGGGFVKLVADESTGEILGVHVAGHRATDLIHEAVLAMTSELVVEDLAAAIHAHPTFSEGVGEAPELWLGRGIHAR